MQFWFDYYVSIGYWFADSDAFRRKYGTSLVNDDRSVIFLLSFDKWMDVGVRTRRWKLKRLHDAKKQKENVLAI